MPITKTRAASRAHYFLVINDPDFYEDLSAEVNKDDVIRRYGLSREDIDVSMKDYKLLKDSFFPFTGGWFKFNETSNEFAVYLKADVKQHEIQNLWRNLQKFRNTHKIKQLKLKPPDDPELLYAVFKSRVRGHTFPQIFELYQSGKLSSYENKPTNNFQTEFDLKKYYSKYYKPL